MPDVAHLDLSKGLLSRVYIVVKGPGRETSASRLPSQHMIPGVHIVSSSLRMGQDLWVLHQVASQFPLCTLGLGRRVKSTLEEYNQCHLVCSCQQWAVCHPAVPQTWPFTHTSQHTSRVPRGQRPPFPYSAFGMCAKTQKKTSLSFSIQMRIFGLWEGNTVKVNFWLESGSSVYCPRQNNCW